MKTRFALPSFCWFVWPAPIYH